MSITYRSLAIEDCSLIISINPSQYINRAWREVDGVRQLISIHYQDCDWPNGYEYHYNRLRETILTGGEAIGGFDRANKLIGFATLNRASFGIAHTYVLLDQLFISLEHRNKSILSKSNRKIELSCLNSVY